MNRITSPAISLPRSDAFARADLEFVGVDHSGPSYQARVFVDNPGANEQTPATPDAGYVGAFHIVGHGGYYGSAGHCDLRGPIHAYDAHLPHQLTPQTKLVQATDTIKRLVAAGGDSTTVTIVARTIASPAYDQPPTTPSKSRASPSSPTRRRQQSRRAPLSRSSASANRMVEPDAGERT